MRLPTFSLSQECKYTVKRQTQTHTCTHTLYPLHRQTQPMSGTLVIMDIHMLNHSDNYSCVSLFVWQSVYVYMCECVLFAALSVFLLVVEVIWKECSGKGGALRPLNQQGRASNESAALTRADANWRASQCGVTNTHRHTHAFTSSPATEHIHAYSKKVTPFILEYMVCSMSVCLCDGADANSFYNWQQQCQHQGQAAARISISCVHWLTVIVWDHQFLMPLRWGG